MCATEGAGWRLCLLFLHSWGVGFCEGWRSEAPKCLAKSFSTVQKMEKVGKALSTSEEVFHLHSPAADFAFKDSSCL